MPDQVRHDDFGTFYEFANLQWDNMMSIKLERQEKYKALVMAIFLAGACFFTYYFHAVLETGKVFTHFFYIPIILAAMWWRRKGLVVAVFLALLIIFSHIFVRAEVMTANDYLRAIMFVVIAFVVATLSEQIAKAQGKTVRLNAILRVIRNVNHLIVREKDRDRLLKSVCENLIEARRYYSAWIALVDKNHRFLTAAEAGLGESFSPLVAMMKRGEFAQCTQKALEQSGIVMVEDVAATCTNCPLVGIYAGRAGMAICLEYRDRIYGILAVSIPARKAADADEQSLFDEMAHDIAFALRNIELEEERKKAERELKREKNFSKNIITTVPESLVVVNKDLRIRSANRTFYETFQTEPEKATGASLCNILHDKDGKVASELTGIFGTEDMLEKFEVVYQSEKRGERIFDVTARGIIHAAAAAAAAEEEEEEEALVVIRDITGRRRAQEALQRFSEELESRVEERTKELRKERDYTRHLIDSSPDFQMTLNKDGRIMGVNEEFEKIVGKSRGGIIGSSVYEYLPKKEIEKAILEILEKKKIRNIELTAHIPGKGDLILSLSGTVFTTREGELGIYATGRDITELRTKEMELIHAGRLASLGEMAAGVAHEINQPLSVISMAAEGTLRDIEKKCFDMSILSQDLEDILGNVKRIDRIITHMRTYVRKLGEWESVEPDEVLNNAFVLLGEQFKVHDISVSRKTEENLPLIKLDVNQLEQVFINILINARQVLNERGEEAEKEGESFEKQLVCGTSREIEKGKQWVIYKFADNAYGVPDESKRRVFEPFFTTKEPGEGTGLGLSIAYSTVTQLLGGRIWVEDNKMGGASFKVAVPVKVRGQRSEVRGQRTEVRSRRSEVGSQRSEVGSQGSVTVIPANAGIQN